MKNFFLIISLLFFSFVNAQLYTSGGTLQTTSTTVSSSNVGIGVSDPVNHLTVGNNSGGVISITTNSAYGTNNNPLEPTLSFLGYANQNKAKICATEATGNMYGSKLSFFVNNDTSANNLTERLSILANGNIGVDNPNPTKKLEVNGDIKATNYFGTDYSFSKLFGNDNPTYYYIGNGYHLGKLTPLLDLKWYGGIRFGDGTGDVMEIYNGMVGIGTANPDQKLTVNGKIHSQELIVELEIAPDYVFEKYFNGFSNLKSDYTMPTLPEVAKFVKENNHLPSMPSAKEIKEKGLEVGQMSALLLQKIEELTLYVIEQDNKIKALEEKNKK